MASTPQHCCSKCEIPISSTEIRTCTSCAFTPGEEKEVHGSTCRFQPRAHKFCVNCFKELHVCSRCGGKRTHTVKKNIFVPIAICTSHSCPSFKEMKEHKAKEQRLRAELTELSIIPLEDRARGVRPDMKRVTHALQELTDHVINPPKRF